MPRRRSVTVALVLGAALVGTTLHGHFEARAQQAPAAHDPSGSSYWSAGLSFAVEPSPDADPRTQRVEMDLGTVTFGAPGIADGYRHVGERRIVAFTNDDAGVGARSDRTETVDLVGTWEDAGDGDSLRVATDDGDALRVLTAEDGSALVAARHPDSPSPDVVSRLLVRRSATPPTRRTLAGEHWIGFLEVTIEDDYGSNALTAYQSPVVGRLRMDARGRFRMVLDDDFDRIVLVGSYSILTEGPFAGGVQLDFPPLEGVPPLVLLPGEGGDLMVGSWRDAGQESALLVLTMRRARRVDRRRIRGRYVSYAFDAWSYPRRLPQADGRLVTIPDPQLEDYRSAVTFDGSRTVAIRDEGIRQVRRDRRVAGSGVLVRRRPREADYTSVFGVRRDGLIRVLDQGDHYLGALSQDGRMAFLFADVYEGADFDGIIYMVRTPAHDVIPGEAPKFAETDTEEVGPGSGSLDLEVPNRARVLGTLDPPGERETVRLRVPEGASLDVEVRGLRKGPVMQVRVFAEDGGELRPADPLAIPGGMRIRSLDVPGGGLVSLDLRGDGSAVGDYRLIAAWTGPPVVAVAGMAGGDGLDVPFPGEAGSVCRVSIRGAPADLVARLRLPSGAEEETTLRRGRGTLRLAESGVHVLVLESASGGSVKGTLRIRPPRRREVVDVREARVRRGRVVSRTVGAEGGDVSVPPLAPDQLVAVDAGGAGVEIPEGKLGLPVTFVLSAARDLGGARTDVTAAGVAVEFSGTVQASGDEVVVTLPFDPAAFPLGTDSIRVLTRAADGTETEVTAPLTVDLVAGTVSFAVAHFSAYQAFGPGLVLEDAAIVDTPGDLVTAPDGSVYVLEDQGGRVFRIPPGGGPAELFLGGGFTTQDGVHRLNFLLDDAAALAVRPDGTLLVADAPFGSRVYEVGGDDLVVRLAGDFSTRLVEGAQARDTGLPRVVSLVAGPGGDLLLLTHEGSHGRVCRIDGEDGTVETVAGLGSIYREDADPLDEHLWRGGALLLDTAGRLLVATESELLRIDLDERSVVVLAGRSWRNGTDGGAVSDDVLLGGRGSPVAGVAFSRISDMAFDGSGEDVLLVADAGVGALWRLDLGRDRAHVLAGARFTPESGAGLPEGALQGLEGVTPTEQGIYLSERWIDTVRLLRPAD